ncbi:MAG: RNA polymerase sigma factor [Gemmatimonadetes bacterium]|nr:RNA polymerase sigma factor [Gemmatimonadota bacterium]
MAHPALPTPDLEASLAALHEAGFAWARSCCQGDPDLAADVLQTTYVKILAGNARFAGRSSFRTWLFGVIRLTSLELQRRGGRELPFDADTDAESGDASAELEVIRAEEHEALRAALGRLPDRQREVLHLVFQQEMTIAEAAGVMGVSLGSARVHYERAKKRLRALLVAGGHGRRTGQAPGDLEE